ncbi:MULTISPECIES: hypothetical protein [unclassified Paracoccus (in: a-proteobacteria)]|uniref:hypothetical protein n=1 Tax=unclassified Paracoccus (in: a-proteobacteria) TaxID=2688777 RepID=UPI0012B1B838|nr:MULTISPECIES: hypothetical protein [unclassified Paracoccus (in: a-proteobacteria)]UXU74907.1 hypothetical protein GB879_013630 [Paracoccus sp. SMMA_5]UXU80810.1 hypothetical protein GB880_013625 [Paracoccus sp. SMMA_5_TC]
MTAEWLYQGPHQRLVRFRGTGTRGQAVVSFEHGRDRMDGYAPAQPPRFALRLGLDVLLVQTARRDWFLSPASAALAQALAQATADYAEVIATGFSMGGYGALLYSRACRASRVLLVSPQYSIDPAIAPFDPDRHGKFTRIGRPMPRPESWGDPQVGGVLIHDPRIAADRGHAALIAAAFPRLHHVALPFGGHPATLVLGEAGRGVGRIAEALVHDTLDPAAIRADHRAARRRSLNYHLHLARTALPRHRDRALARLADLAQTGTDHIRFEAGLALLEAGDERGAALLSNLLDQVVDPPAAWARRLQRALQG